MPQQSRVDWVDYAKGFCIVMVVMMHSTLGVEQAAGREGWMHAVVAFARPFRMPDFFLISGLFLARVIDRDWRDYLDKKVVHFAYFYVLWVTIQFAFKAPMFAADVGWRGVGFAYLEAFIEPFGTLWFIYLLPIFFVVVKLTRGMPWIAIWLVGAALEIVHIDTGWTVIDEFAHRFVYFYSGYVVAPHVFALAARVRRKPLAALRRAVGLGAGQRRAGVGRLRRPPVRFAGPGLRRRRSRGRGRGDDGAKRCVSTAALLRSELDRHLPRVLPADGGDPHRAAEDRHHYRSRHDFADRYTGRRHRRVGLVLGGSRHGAALPIRAARMGAPAARASDRDAARGMIHSAFRAH